MKKPQTQKLPLLAITMGDPAGIGPEIILKALAGSAVQPVCRPLVIGSFPVMTETARRLKLKMRMVPIQGHEPFRFGGNDVAVLDPLETPLQSIQMGRAAAETGAASVAFIKTAVRVAMAGCADGIVTAPINKEAINLGGCRYPGHTELLADLTDSAEAGMMIVGGPLRIMFVTTHVAIRDLSTALTAERIGKAIRLADQALRDSFGVKKPRIAVAALNPHAGEAGLFGDEEARSIAPAIAQARGAGIDASDPVPADTLFAKAARGEYDGIVAMYHDQGLIPLKLLAFGRCVNTTIGLPIVRTSVDHGTAYDIAGKGVADPGSLIEAIRVAAELVRRRKALNRKSRTVNRESAG